MKITVNLASRPYVELRPVYNRLRTWTAILLLVGVALWFLYRSERIQAQDAVARVTAVENHVHALEQQRQHYETLMQEPKNAAILRQSDFLNALFRHKAFSWTATMTDLETVLPSGVQVLSIDPIVAPDGHVVIRLRVTGDRDRALDLIRNLEKSQHFAQPRLASESLATSQGAQAAMQSVANNNMVNFDILADYRPLPIPVNAKQGEESPNPAAADKAHAGTGTKRRTRPSPARATSAPGRAHPR